jgi:hypothetical protein
VRGLESEHQATDQPEGEDERGESAHATTP